MTKAQLGWWVGLGTCVCGALLGQAELVGEPYRHWIAISFIVGTAISGYQIQKPGQ